MQIFKSQRRVSLPIEGSYDEEKLVEAMKQSIVQEIASGCNEWKVFTHEDIQYNEKVLTMVLPVGEQNIKYRTSTIQRRAEEMILAGALDPEVYKYIFEKEFDGVANGK